MNVYSLNRNSNGRMLNNVDDIQIRDYYITIKLHVSKVYITNSFSATEIFGPIIKHSFP